MTTIPALTVDNADKAAVPTLNAIKGKFGMIPNLFATLAHSPTALNSLVTLSGAVEAGTFTAREREIVALATSQANSCQYCVSAHSLLGKKEGLDAQQLKNARTASPAEGRDASIAAFAKALVDQRGHIAPATVHQFKTNGLTDSDLLEILANVVATTFTNYTNNVAGTDIDFPVVSLELNS